MTTNRRERLNRRTGAEPERARPTPDVAPAKSNPLQDLQRRAGNSAVVALLSAGQAKLTVGAANDPYEREADAVARQVVSVLRSGGEEDEHEDDEDGGGSGAFVESEGGESEEEEEIGRVVRRVQRRAAPEVGAEGGDLSADTEQAIQASRGGGRGLDSGIRPGLERALNADLSGVQIHSGPKAAALNDAVQAKAFTVGSDIFLGSGTPSLSSEAGQELLAHELTHTIQQGAVQTHGD